LTKLATPTQVDTRPTPHLLLTAPDRYSLWPDA